MGQAVTRKLVFRIAGVGFAVDLDRVVEICVSPGASGDTRYSDSIRGIVGAFDFRQTRIPLVDPAVMLKLRPAVVITQQAILVLKGPEGNWGMLADEVGAIIPAHKLLPCALPALLNPSVQNHYTAVALLDGEPLVLFEPNRFYGASP